MSSVTRKVRKVLDTKPANFRLYTTVVSRKRAVNVANVQGYYKQGKDYEIKRIARGRYEVYLDLLQGTSTAQPFIPKVRRK